MEPHITRYADAEVPTDYGPLRLIVYREEGSAVYEHVALVRGTLEGKSNVLVRVHSECFTGEVLHSLKCDCREQLEMALRVIGRIGEGAVLYLRQEGRGIGLGNKIRAYALQQRGLDTVEADRMLGFSEDSRSYHVAALMLADLGVRSVALLTNNPQKVAALRDDGVVVSTRVPMRVNANDFNRGYLETKRVRMGHLIDIEQDEPALANEFDSWPPPPMPEE